MRLGRDESFVARVSVRVERLVLGGGKAQAYLLRMHPTGISAHSRHMLQSGGEREKRELLVRSGLVNEIFFDRRTQSRNSIFIRFQPHCGLMAWREKFFLCLAATIDFFPARFCLIKSIFAAFFCAFFFAFVFGIHCPSHSEELLIKFCASIGWRKTRRLFCVKNFAGLEPPRCGIVGCGAHFAQQIFGFE